MLTYPDTHHEAVERPPSNVVAVYDARPVELKVVSLLDMVKALQAERQKDLEMREQLLTTELNRVRGQLGKAPISNRKIEALKNRVCQNCGFKVE